MLSLEGVGFWRGERGAAGGERVILNNITWAVGRSQVAAVLGPNGCGKSTLLRIAAGYLWPQRGRVRLLGQVFGETPLAPLRARVGIVEASTIYPFDEQMTAQDVVISGYFSALTLGYVHPTGEQVAHGEHLLGQVGLGEGGGQLYVTLSTGERLRCLLARALVRRPELLLLDEPTAGLDLPARETILATLSRLHGTGSAGGTKNGPAMVTITHHLEELLPQTENVLLLSGAGKVVAAGAPEKVLTGENLSAAYGVAIEVERRNGRYMAHVDPATWEELL